MKWACSWLIRADGNTEVRAAVRHHVVALRSDLALGPVVVSGGGWPLTAIVWGDTSEPVFVCVGTSTAGRRGCHTTDAKVCCVTQVTAWCNTSAHRWEDSRGAAITARRN